MVVKGQVHRNTYRDSLVLMRVAGELSQRRGISRVEIILGTPANLDALRRGGLFAPELESATPNDLVAAVEAGSEETAGQALAAIDRMLMAVNVIHDSEAETAFSLQAALHLRPDANLALLSIPGQFVKREATRALEQGLNLLIFSDNVPIEDEIEMKRLAGERGLLVMGPDCGSAILNGISLGFANRVRRGSIGVVAASGTGLQEVSCLIDRAGQGVSHGIGTGTNDVKDSVGGATLVRALRLLEDDPETRVIVIVTKPPEEAVTRKILGEVRNCTKPVIVNFLGGDVATIAAAGARPAVTLEDAARLAVEAAGGVFSAGNGDWDRLEQESGKLAPTQKQVRGVFSGGTLAAEAALVLAQQLGEVYTNTSLGRARRLEDARRSVGHTCVDLGDDEFTLGKPHPMLEPLMRHERLLQEADDPETAVLLLDVVLGFGVHRDPAGVLASSMSAARRRAAAGGRYLPFVVSVCGTDGDPQIRSSQVARLRDAGALVFRSNAEAARSAARIALRTAM